MYIKHKDNRDLQLAQLCHHVSACSRHVPVVHIARPLAHFDPVVPAQHADGGASGSCLLRQ